ncbi:MAG: hypothetical protein IK075_03825 [Prevotella sp.]|nr:hypothetical protein [Prevotella sp.]
MALVFAASSAFVSCKDNDADVKTELYGDLAKLQERIKTLEDNACKCDGYSKSEVDAKIKALQDAIDLINSNLKNYVTFAELPAEVQKLLKDYYTKEEVDKLLEGIGKGKEGLTEEEVKKLIDEALKDYTYSKDEISKLLEDVVASLEEEIANIFKTQVTSLNIDAVKNPIFGFLSAPIDVQSNILIACYGKASSDIEFPVGSGEYIAYADDVLTLDNNAGKLYVTVNPSSVDFSGKTLTLEGTSGKQAPVELSPLTPSKQELLFGWTRAENAFYETTATIPADKLNDLAVDITKQDLLDLKDDVKYLLQERQHTKRGAVNLLKDLYDIYTRNMYSAYRLKATWGENNYNTFSETKIAALALKPLSYSFDPEGAISVKDLEAMEDEITGTFTSDGKKVTGTATDENGKTATVEIDANDEIHTAINKFWNVFNGLVQKGLDNVNYALQPCLLIQEGTKMSRVTNYYKHSYIGEILLVPTSRSAEVFAPAYKKYLKVTCDGEEVEGELLNKVIDGTVLAIPLTLESGKKYEIEYQAVDYTGVTRVKNYTIYGY